MQSKVLSFILVSALSLCCVDITFSRTTESLIPFQSFQLENGLKVIVHEDQSSPVIGITLWYHVGSKNERRGQTGIAHLSEHLMFNGSDHYNDKYFKPLESVGATDINGATSVDRTALYQTVPPDALDLALWMESERMGHLIGALDQKKLDDQRRVVLNEMMQDENRPYNKAKKILLEQSFPYEHPYSWPIIGSTQDINNIELKDIKAWFRDYFRPANATLVLAGKITFTEAQKKVNKYFSHIPAGNTVEKQKQWIAKRQHSKKVVAYDYVPQPRLYMQWNTPPIGTKEADNLSLISEALGKGRNSRLFKRIVTKEKLATDLQVFSRPQEIAGTFQIVVDAKPGVPLKRIEQIIREELLHFARVGPSHNELQRIKRKTVNRFLRRFESVGGRYGKSYYLARGQVYIGDPNYFQKKIHHWEKASAKELKKTASNWILSGDVVLEYLPIKERQTHVSTVDRNLGPPKVKGKLDVNLPIIQKLSLSNGLEVVLVPSEKEPQPHSLTEIQLLFDAGFAADPKDKRGLAAFSLELFEEGTQILDGAELSERFDEIGAKLNVKTQADVSKITLSVLSKHTREALFLLSQLIQEPGFREEDIQDKKSLWDVKLAREAADPARLSKKLMPILLYGDEHPYGNALSGMGNRKSLMGYSRQDVMAFQKQWYRPEKATLILVGDLSSDFLLDQLERTFGNWVMPGESGKKKVVPVKEPRSQQAFYLVDKPNASQSYIYAAQLLRPPKESFNTTQHVALQAMNDIFGGSFTSRINLNLRESKGWSYGVRSRLIAYREQYMMIVRAPVQIDKTGETIQEIIRELSRYVGENKATQDELEALITKQVRRIPGKFEKLQSRMKYISRELSLKRLDQQMDLIERLKTLELESVHQVSEQFIDPSSFKWVIVGDLHIIEPLIKDLKLGDVYILRNDSINL